MFIIIILIILGIATIFSTIRIIIGPTVWDRLLSLSLASSKIIIIIVLYSIFVEQTFYLDVALIFAIIGFIGSISVAKLLRKLK